jgi:hypothetical protein
MASVFFSFSSSHHSNADRGSHVASTIPLTSAPNFKRFRKVGTFHHLRRLQLLQDLLPLIPDFRFFSSVVQVKHAYSGTRPLVPADAMQPHEGMARLCNTICFGRAVTLILY